MSTTGHESELISVSGLKASLQKLKTDKIDTKIDKTAVDNKNATLAYGQQSTVATVGTTDIKVTMPSAPSSTDTKNTAGSTEKASTKLFLIGAESQAANPQTYSTSGVYIGTDGELYSGGKKVMTGGGGGTVDLGDVIIKKLSDEIENTTPTTEQTVTIPHGLNLSEITNVQVKVIEVFNYGVTYNEDYGEFISAANSENFITKAGSSFIETTGSYYYTSSKYVSGSNSAIAGYTASFNSRTQPNVSINENNIVLSNIKVGVSSSWGTLNFNKFFLTLLVTAYK